MAKKRRAEYHEEDDTKPEIDSEEREETEPKAEEDLVKLLEQISKQQLIEVIRSVSSSENKKFTEEIHKLATKSLKEPAKMTGNRMTACDFASSSGPVNYPHQQQMIVRRNSSRENILQRKIFVGNVITHPEITGIKLHSFFSQYGEIEEGPSGFDKYTGKPKGFAIFMYKTVQGARKALEEPIKNFYGHPLYCERVNGGGSASNKLNSGSNGPARNLPLKDNGCNGVGSGSSPRADAGARFDAQNEGMGRRVLLDQWDTNGVTQPYCRGKEPIQGHQLDTSHQIGPSGHDQAKRPALARTGACVACIGYYLEKLILFILCLLGVLFLLSRVLDHVFTD